MRKGPSIRYLLLTANAFILLVPVFAVVFLRLWDGHLVRLTEQQLIAESVLIGEAWRERWLEERGESSVGREPPVLTPIEALLPLQYALLPPAALPERTVQPGDGPEWRAGSRVEPLMVRSKSTNLSGARVLNADGCVVASTNGQRGACYTHLPEVREALSGQYAAVARQRVRDQPPPPLNSFSRRGTVRVFTATPIVHDGSVIGAVYMSRTSSSPLEAVWELRYTVLAALALCIGMTVIISLLFSRRIARPVRAITSAAEAIARGEPAASLAPSGTVPGEVATLAGALQRMTRQLTDRAEYIEQFASTVSHELKTPLTGIRGAMELLREDWQGMSDAQRQRFLENVDADAARMERLVTRLLQLARIQRSPDAAERIELRVFLSQLMHRYDGRVRLELADAPQSITINPDHLETALRNLVDNAVRHGNGQPVDVIVRDLGKRVSITVSDHGSGISEGNRQRVFERFFTTERDHGGTGLGLAIVKAVAEVRGGSVSFETGHLGTTFTLVL
ncbi:MAG: HAMP domain-containing protein [Deltaproteobacteria bacterium]|nr:HAMP domain-containing protein [Deltaproteobacteria bacterium]